MRPVPQNSRMAMATKNGAAEMMTLQFADDVYVSATFSSIKYSVTPVSPAPAKYHSCFLLASRSLCGRAAVSARMASASRTQMMAAGEKSRKSTVEEINVVPQTITVNSASRWPPRAPRNASFNKEPFLCL